MHDESVLCMISLCVWHDPSIFVKWRIHMCHITHSYVWYDLSGMFDISHLYVWQSGSFRAARPMSFLRVMHEQSACVKWLIHVCHVTHSYVWHDSFTYVTCLIVCVTWFIHMRDMTDLCVSCDSLICVTWLIHICDMTHSMCDMTHSYAWHDSFMCVTWLIHAVALTWLVGMCGVMPHVSFMCVTWLLGMCHMTHSYE